jgi:hypothetical protein
MFHPVSSLSRILVPNALCPSVPNRPAGTLVIPAPVPLCLSNSPGLPGARTTFEEHHHVHHHRHLCMSIISSEPVPESDRKEDRPPR